MARRFLNSSNRGDDGWKRLSGVSDQTFYVRHDTFISVTTSDNTSPARRNFTIRKRTLEESEQLQKIKKDQENAETFDPRAKLKKVSGANEEKNKNNKTQEVKQKKSKDGDKTMERRNSKKLVKKKKKNDKNVEGGKLDDVSESVRLREKSINNAADERADEADKLAQAAAEEANSHELTEQIDETNNNIDDGHNVDTGKLSSIEIVIDEAPDVSNENSDDANVPPTPDLVRSSKLDSQESTEVTGEENKHEESVSKLDNKTQEDTETESLVGKLMIEFQNCLEEAKNAAKLVEENVKIALEQAAITDNISEHSDNVDIDAIFAAAEASQLKSMESKICEESMKEAFDKALEVQKEISANLNQAQTPDLVRSSKVGNNEKNDEEGNTSSSAEFNQIKTCQNSIAEFETISNMSSSLTADGEKASKLAKERADFLFESLKNKSESTEENPQDVGKRDVLIKLIQSFYQKVEDARNEATLVAEKANEAAEKADIAENVKNLIEASEAKYDQVDVETVVDAAEASRANANETNLHSDLLQDIIKDILDIFEDISANNDTAIATPDIVRSIKISCKPVKEESDNMHDVDQDHSDYDLIKDCEACIYELTTIEDQVKLLNVASVNSAELAEIAADIVQNIAKKQDQQEAAAAEVAVDLRLDEEDSLKVEEEERMRLEQEARLKTEEEERFRLEEEARLKAEEEERLRLEEEARLKDDEEEKLRLEEEARLTAEEEERLRLEEEERLKAEEEERLRCEEEARLKAEEEERLRLEEEARLKAEEEERLRLEEEARLKAEEEERLRLEEEARLKAEEEKRLRFEEEARQKAEEEEKLRVEEEARLKAEEEERLRLEEEARLKAEEEERLRLEEEARLKAEEEERRRLEREARLKVEEEERRRLEEEARKKAEEARLKAEEEARIRAEEEAKQRAIEEAKRKVAEEEAIARRIAEAERRIAEQEKLREIERLERLKQEEEERRLAEIKRKQYEEHLEKYEQLITVEAEKIAGTQPPAFFGGRKFEQIENIKLFLRTKLSLDQFMQKPTSFDSLMKGSR